MNAHRKALEAGHGEAWGSARASGGWRRLVGETEERVGSPVGRGEMVGSGRQAVEDDAFGGASSGRLCTGFSSQPSPRGGRRLLKVRRKEWGRGTRDQEGERAAVA